MLGRRVIAFILTGALTSASLVLFGIPAATTPLCKCSPCFDSPTLVKAIEFNSVPNLYLTGEQCVSQCLKHASNSNSSSDTHVSVSQFRALFYLSWSEFNAHMDRHRFHLYCGALASANLTNAIAMWGPGWPGYNNSLSPALNIDRRWGPGFFHAIVGPRSIGVQGPVYVGYQHECFHELRSITECADDIGRYDIQLLTYEQHIHNQELQVKLAAKHGGQTLLAFWPHSALPGPFVLRWKTQQTNIMARPYDFCLIGSVDPVLYPMRNRLQKWMADGVFQAQNLVAMQYVHPGYTDLLTEAQRKERNINVTSLEAQYEKYVSFLFRCKLVAVTRSSRNYELRKYVEAAMAGTLLIGDVPSQTASYTRVWRSIVLDVRSDVLGNRSDNVIRKIKQWLSPEYEPLRSQRVTIALQFVYGQRTFQHAWMTIKELHHMHMLGLSGVVTLPWRNPNYPADH